MIWLGIPGHSGLRVFLDYGAFVYLSKRALEWRLVGHFGPSTSFSSLTDGNDERLLAVL